MDESSKKEFESGKNEGVGETEERKTAEQVPEEKGAGEAEKWQDLNDRYLRLYAEFENYRKRVSREKEDLINYGNEALLYELLPAIDHLELALKHASHDSDNGVVQGVDITLKELRRTLEKFGLRRIESTGKCFDPAVHHAMTQVEREDIDEKMVVEEFRAGYLYRDKVLRPSLVAVSVKPRKSGDQGTEAGSPDETQIETNVKIEEEEDDG
ncbi:MAG: nucleotide exchange factor GrpE [Candidatus Sulfobium sp.]